MVFHMLHLFSFTLLGHVVSPFRRRWALFGTMRWCKAPESLELRKLVQQLCAGEVRGLYCMMNGMNGIMTSVFWFCKVLWFCSVAIDSDRHQRRLPTLDGLRSARTRWLQRFAAWKRHVHAKATSSKFLVIYISHCSSTLSRICNLGTWHNTKERYLRQRFVFSSPITLPYPEQIIITISYIGGGWKVLDWLGLIGFDPPSIPDYPEPNMWNEGALAKEMHWQPQTLGLEGASFCRLFGNSKSKQMVAGLCQKVWAKALDGEHLALQLRYPHTGRVLQMLFFPFF